MSYKFHAKELLMPIVSRSTIVVTALLAGLAFADSANSAAAKPESVEAEKKSDPIICERVEEVGSRLHVRKVCMTKSQWDEQRRGDRANIERSQVQHPMNSGN